MSRTVFSAIERWPLARPFRIARGVKTVAEVALVELTAAGVVGRGESVPYVRYGETPESVLAQIKALEPRLAAGLTRAELATALPPGAARNAIDCALWDLALKSGEATLARPAPITTALTVGIDTPACMAEAATAIDGPLIKVKVDAAAPGDALRAVRAARPDAILIVDPNESWSFALLQELQPLLAALAIAFVEQPIAAADDACLEGFTPLVPICADESCHVAADLPALRRRYGLVNLKLDKAGGLSEALAMLDQARALGFGVMVGCMICTSLSIAPALRLAGRADYADLDGPWWLARDRPGGVRLEGGRLLPPAPGFWG